MTSSAFDLRLVAYSPLGAKIGVLPDLGFTVTGTGAASTLTATVSSAIFATGVPTVLEVAVEWWHVSTNSWSEGRDCRFAVSGQGYDDRDLTGTITLTGVNILAFLMGGASLAGVEPYVNTGGVTETNQGNTTTSLSGDVFTWNGHGLITGDRVRINNAGTAKNLDGGSVYYAINVSTNQFQLARSAAGSAVKCGAGTVNLRKVVTKITFPSAHQFTKSMAVQVIMGGSATITAITANSTYFVAAIGPTWIQLTDKPGGVPIELVQPQTAIPQVYRYLDGQRFFNNAHPGVVMARPFDEAQARGWGATLARSFTSDHDSAGNAWATMADDPDTPGVSVGFQPGTAMTTMLQFLLDNGYAEWYQSAPRTLNVVNVGTGIDRTASATPMRIGTEATALPVTVDLTGIRNAITVRGTGSIIKEYDSPAGPWGRMEAYETSTGATTAALAAKQAKTDGTVNSVGQIGYQVTENAQEATWLPMKDYSRGDYVAIQLSSAVWKTMRVVEWQYIKAANGVITVTSTLQFRKKPLLVKVASVTNFSSAGLTDTGSASSPILQSDNRKPAAPNAVTTTQVPRFAADDTSSSTVTVSWAAVSSDITGGDVQVVNYEVWLRGEGSYAGTVYGQTAGLSLALAPLPSGHFYTVQVRARTDQGQWGELSPEQEFQTQYPAATPAPPTTPTVSSKLGQIAVNWNGTLNDPALGASAPGYGFAYVYAAFSTTQNGTYTPVGLNMPTAGTTPITGLTVGTTYWFALFAVNSVAGSSLMSTPVSLTVLGVKGPDIEANSVTTNLLAAGAIDGFTITGAIIRTATDLTKGGVQLDGNGLVGYDAAGSAAFRVTTSGALSVGPLQVNASHVKIGGSISDVTSVIDITTGGIAGYDSNGLVAFKLTNTGALTVGPLNVSPSHVTIGAAAGMLATSVDITTNGIVAYDTNGNAVTKLLTDGTFRAGPLVIQPGHMKLGTQDPTVSSNIFDFTMSNIAAIDSTGTTQWLIDRGGNMTVGGVTKLTSAYSNAVSGRSMFFDSTGQVGYSSSRAEHKDILGEWAPDLDSWYALTAIHYVHHANVEGREEVGFTAEDVFGLDPRLAYLDADGRPESVAYERFGVAEHAAGAAMYARLKTLEDKVRTLEAA